MTTSDVATVEWNIRTLADAYRERPPTEYVVDKFLATQSLNIVYGAPGVMKSLLMADLCIHVVGGLPWLPPNGVEVMQAPVLWLDLDNGQRRTDERFDALGRAAGLQPDDPLYYVSMPNPPLIAHDIDSMMILHEIIYGYAARLVVIDNLGLITGDVEENSAMMAQIMGNLRTVAERTGAAVVVIHHQRKGGAQNSRAGDALRGHSSIEAAIDLGLHVTREGNAAELMIRSTKTRGVDVPTLMARFNYEHRQGTNDLERAWFDGIEMRRGENPVRDSILFYVEGNEEITHTKLVQLVYEDLNGEASRSKIRAWIDDMANITGELEMDKGLNNAKIFRVPNGQKSGLPI